MAKPIVASYCSLFLRKEMLHIYRQLTGLQRYQTTVLTQERLNPELYPFEPVIVLPNPQINLLRRVCLKYFYRTEPLLYRGEFGALAKSLEQVPASLMHIFFGHVGAHLGPFIQRWHRPVVVSFHGMDVMPRPEDARHLRRMKQMFDHATLIMTRSESLKREVVALGCPVEKIRLNPTGLPLRAFPYVGRTAPPNGAWQLVQVCRLIEKKGLDTTLEVFARFRGKHPAARLHLAGEGPRLEALQSRCRELGVADQVEFHGFLSGSALLDLLQRSHVFLHPSRRTSAADQEGIPNSMLEAMATGLPVVATQHGGIPEVVLPGQNGELGPENDVESLLGALQTVVGESYPDYSRRAAESVRQKFDQAASIAALESIYDEAIDLFKPTPGVEERWNKWVSLVR